MSLTSDDSPISRLSDDDLAIIFLHFPVPVMSMRDPSVSSATHQDFAPCLPDLDLEDKTWLRISHVCRRWRSLSLSCSTIWSTINIASLRSKQALASLERAKRSPLTIIVDWTTLYTSQLNDLKELVVEALFHLPHTRHLVIRGEMPRSAFERVVPVMQAQEADILETLQLSTKIYTHESDLDPVTLPDAIMQCAPRLRKVALHGTFSFNWCNVVFSGDLTHLSLSHIATRSLPTSEALLGLLGRCPLQVLSLIASLPTPATSRHLVAQNAEERLVPKLGAGYTKLYLSHLSRCHLEDHGLEVADFIRRIEVPATCHVSLYLGRQDRDADFTGVTPSPFTPILESVRDFCLTRNTLHKASLRFEQRRGSRAHWTFAGQVSDAPDAPRSVIEVSMGGSADPDVVFVAVQDAPPGSFLSGMFRMVSATFPLEIVRSVHISVRSTTCKLFWDVLVLDLERLESITIEGPSTRGFAELMQQYAYLPHALPKLIEVTIAHVDMNTSVMEVVQPLESAFRRRLHHGTLPPLTLTLQHCLIDGNQRERLEKATGRPVQGIGEPDIWELDGGVSSEEDDDSDWDTESEPQLSSVEEFPYGELSESDEDSEYGADLD
ncbi:hypothetical protein PENSPDRAFT_442874 [Peniophora sp. CONT]|nr:hypothetical protein PENSPDRAFT_442874 [Peniophora sp. CONT]